MKKLSTRIPHANFKPDLSLYPLLYIFTSPLVIFPKPLPEIKNSNQPNSTVREINSTNPQPKIADKAPLISRKYQYSPHNSTNIGITSFQLLNRLTLVLIIKTTNTTPTKRVIKALNLIKTLQLQALPKPKNEYWIIAPPTTLPTIRIKQGNKTSLLTPADSSKGKPILGE